MWNSSGINQAYTWCWRPFSGKFPRNTCKNLKSCTESVFITPSDFTPQQLTSLHEQVEKKLEEIAESHSNVAVQLRELISWLYDAYDDTSDSVCYTTHQTTITESSLPASSSSNSSSPISHSSGNDIGHAPMKTTSLSSPKCSLWSRIPWSEEVKNPTLYSWLWGHGVDWSSGSVFSNDSSGTKGVAWSILSDMSLGDLPISEISVLELPISLSDLYDPIPYQQSIAARHKQAHRGSTGVLGGGCIEGAINLHSEHYSVWVLIPRRLLTMAHYWFMRPSRLMGLCFAPYCWIEVCMLTRGISADTHHCCIAPNSIWMILASYCWIGVLRLTLLIPMAAPRSRILLNAETSLLAS